MHTRRARANVQSIINHTHSMLLQGLACVTCCCLCKWFCMLWCLVTWCSRLCFTWLSHSRAYDSSTLSITTSTLHVNASDSKQHQNVKHQHQHDNNNRTYYKDNTDRCIIVLYLYIFIYVAVVCAVCSHQQFQHKTELQGTEL
jgi:hypothetical protein